jgi:hypothetical protein
MALEMLALLAIAVPSLVSVEPMTAIVMLDVVAKKAMVYAKTIHSKLLLKLPVLLALLL